MGKNIFPFFGRYTPQNVELIDEIKSQISFEGECIMGGGFTKKDLN